MSNTCQLCQNEYMENNIFILNCKKEKILICKDCDNIISKLVHIQDINAMIKTRREMNFSSKETLELVYGDYAKLLIASTNEFDQLLKQLQIQSINEI